MADGVTRGGAEEMPLGGLVDLRHGEERGVVEGDGRGQRVADGHRVMRGELDVAAAGPGDRGQSDLLPGHAGSATVDGRADVQDAGPGDGRGEVRGVVGAGDDAQSHSLVREGGQEIVDVASDPGEVGGYRGGVHKHVHGGSLPLNRFHGSRRTSADHPPSPSQPPPPFS